MQKLGESMHNISLIKGVETSFGAEDINEAIFENRFYLEKSLADLKLKFPNLLVKDIDLKTIQEDIDSSNKNKYFDFLRNFKFFNLHKFDKDDTLVSELKKELKRIYVISDIRANNPYLKPTEEKGNKTTDQSSRADPLKSSKCSKKLKNSCSMVYFDKNYKLTYKIPKYDPYASLRQKENAQKTAISDPSTLPATYESTLIKRGEANSSRSSWKKFKPSDEKVNLVITCM
jgi:hypothetical protein